MKLKVLMLIFVSLLLIAGCSPAAVDAPAAVGTAASATPSAAPSPSHSLSTTPVPTATPTATEKAPPKDLDQQIHDFLSKTGDYTEENINKKIITDSAGKRTKLGIVNFGDSFECWLFDYHKTDDYILLTVGFDGKDDKRLVTELAIPVYVYENGNFNDYNLVFSKIPDSVIVDGMNQTSSASSGEDMCAFLENLKDCPIIVYSTVDKYTDSTKGYNDASKKFIKEYNNKIKLVKELFYEIADNGLNPDFDEPDGVSLINITGKDDIDKVDVKKVPIILNDIWY